MSANKTLITKVMIGVFSLGTLGFLIWYFGLLDLMVSILIQTMVFIPMVLVVAGALDAHSYNKMMDELEKHVDDINARISASVGMSDTNTNEKE